MEMTSAEKHVNKISQSWEGRDYRPGDDHELREVLGRAFDYRGDVTIQLKTGDQIVGYVFDRNEGVAQPYIKMFLADQQEPQTIAYQNITGVKFSGEDTAFGRSWEDWAQKSQKPQPS